MNCYTLKNNKIEEGITIPTSIYSDLSGEVKNCSISIALGQDWDLEYFRIRVEDSQYHDTLLYGTVLFKEQEASSNPMDNFLSNADILMLPIKDYNPYEGDRSQLLEVHESSYFVLCPKGHTKIVTSDFYTITHLSNKLLLLMTKTLTHNTSHLLNQDVVILDL